MSLRRLLAVPFIVLLSSGSLSAFLITRHIEVTENGLKKVETTLSSLARGRHFTNEAIRQIESANVSRDTGDCSHTVWGSIDDNPAIPCGAFGGIDRTVDDTTLTGEMLAGMAASQLTNPAEHFDDELFKMGNEQIRIAREAAVTDLRMGYYVGARKQTGFALHTIQDFYAHSNWVDMGLACCLSRLGYPDAFINHRLADPQEPMCDDPSTLLTDLFQNRYRLGGYTLTSGYYPNDKPEIAKYHKCEHGEPAKLGRGLNKDSIVLNLDVPGTRWYTRSEAALDVAASHTDIFVRDVLTQGCGANSDCILGFMGYPPTSFNIPKVAGDPLLRDCNQNLYDPATFVFRVEDFGAQLIRWAKADPEALRLIRLGPGQDLTAEIYSAGLLERVPDCIEPVVHVLTGNQVPANGGRTQSSAPGLTLIVKGMPKLHCEAINASGQIKFAQGSFAIRFEPPGPPDNWRPGECVSNPILTILALGKAMPQPNTAYLFFPLN